MIVRGVDVSKWQGCPGTPVAPPDWRAVGESGEAFAFSKAVHGTVLDPSFGWNWTGTRRLLARGAYAYVLLGVDPVRTVDALVAACGELREHDRLALDLEWEDNLSFAGQAQLAERWLERAVRRCIEVANRLPVIYTSAGFWDWLGNPGGTVLSCPLWVAHWHDGPAPLLPRGWSGWQWWQHQAEKGRARFPRRVPGIGPVVDRNFFNGTIEELMLSVEGRC